MKRYLDPKADLTFKKVFGEHPDLMMSFLNAMLPFDSPDEYITHIEYLPSEMVPDNALLKDSIVDVRCTDVNKRQFIVEMQMYWTTDFEQRVLFNASKAYVRQLNKGERFNLLQPVYALSLLNDVFDKDPNSGYYHHYRLVHHEHSEKIIKGLQLIFVELPKFHPHTFSEKRMQVLWLRFLTEINENTSNVSDDLMSDAEIRKAVEQVEEAAFSRDELAAYDAFWLAVSTHKSAIEGAKEEAEEIGMAKGMAKGMAEGMAKGRAEGMAKGIAEGMAKGRAEAMRCAAASMKAMGMDSLQIQKATGLSPEEVEGL